MELKKAIEVAATRVMGHYSYDFRGNVDSESFFNQKFWKKFSWINYWIEQAEQRGD